MAHATWRVLLYALVAATSPLALASTLVVLRSGHGRLNGALYGGAFVMAQTAVLTLLLFVGTEELFTRTGHHQTLQALFALAFGVALLVAAVYVRRHPNRGDRPRVRRGPSRTAAVLARMKGLTPRQALGAGGVLGIGGPKRLGITLIVAGTIAASAPSTGDEVALSAAYIVVGTVLVWLPVTLYLVAGPRAEDWIAGAQGWIGRHEHTLTYYPALVVGLLLVADALVGLLST